MGKPGRKPQRPRIEDVVEKVDPAVLLKPAGPLVPARSARSGPRIPGRPDPAALAARRSAARDTQDAGGCAGTVLIGLW